MNTTTTTTQVVLANLIGQSSVMSCEYDGNFRVVIPLTLGEMKNGRTAVFVYKINTTVPGSSPFRLYYLDKMTNVEKDSITVPEWDGRERKAYMFKTVHEIRG